MSSTVSEVPFVYLLCGAVVQRYIHVGYNDTDGYMLYKVRGYYTGNGVECKRLLLGDANYSGDMETHGGVIGSGNIDYNRYKEFRP